MVRPSLFGSVLATALLLAAACGGALAPESEDAGASSSSSGTPPASGSSTSSGTLPVTRDAGVVPIDASTLPTPGSVSCPAPLAACTTATSVPFVCCVRKNVVYSCEKSADACEDGDAIGCDDNTDCAKGVCCAEEMGVGPIGRFRFVTHCLSTCVTGKPREQVCTSNAECPGATCKEWSCGGFQMHGVKTCAPLGPCD